MDDHFTTEVGIVTKITAYRVWAPRAHSAMEKHVHHS